MTIALTSMITWATFEAVPLPIIYHFIYINSKHHPPQIFHAPPKLESPRCIYSFGLLHGKLKFYPVAIRVVIVKILSRILLSFWFLFYSYFFHIFSVQFHASNFNVLQYWLTTHHYLEIASMILLFFFANALKY